ncbi:MAG: hypothetical protein HQL72_02990 [Magnetococcales bacterium]|nr:hypothetical protein [Magnetococcales bacterium]
MSDMTVIKPQSDGARFNHGHHIVPSSRFFAAMENSNTDIKKKAIVGLIVRTDLSAKYAIPLIGYENPGEAEALFQLVYGLFGGQSEFERKILNPSWQKIIQEKKEALLSELDLPLYKTHTKALAVAGGAFVLLLGVWLFGPFSEKSPAVSNQEVSRSVAVQQPAYSVKRQDPQIPPAYTNQEEPAFNGGTDEVQQPPPPDPVTVVKPAPILYEPDPEPIAIVKPEFAPEPTVVAKPGIIDVEEPAVVAKPEIIDVEEPVVVAKPEPIDVEEPAVVAKPEPIDVEEPAVIAEPEPIIVEEPVVIGEPEPIVVVEPEPLTPSEPVVVSEPESVVVSTAVEGEPGPVEPLTVLSAIGGTFHDLADVAEGEAGLSQQQAAREEITPLKVVPDSKKPMGRLPVTELAPLSSEDGLGFFDSLKVPIVRYWRTPYRATSNNAERVDQQFVLTLLESGDLSVSIRAMLGKTVNNGDEYFAITQESLKDIRLVFQIVPKEAYLFAFDSKGEIIIPKGFWQPFSAVSKKWVGVSRVFKVDTLGQFHIRDIASKRVSDILDTL